MALRDGGLVVGTVNEGAAYLYPYVHQEWSRTGLRLPNNSGEDDNFGISVDIDGAVQIIGAPYRDIDGTNNSGAAWIFERGTAGQIRRLVAPTNRANDQFGYAVAVDGQLILVGVPGDDPGGVANAGRVQVFSGSLFETPRIRSTQKDGDATTLSFPAQPAWRYSVEGTLNLMSGPWLPIPGQINLPGPTGGEFTLTHTNVFGGTVYRVVREAP